MPLSALVCAALFITSEHWQQIHEHVMAMEEMFQVDEEFDRQASA